MVQSKNFSEVGRRNSSSRGPFLAFCYRSGHLQRLTPTYIFFHILELIQEMQKTSHCRFLLLLRPRKRNHGVGSWFHRGQEAEDLSVLPFSPRPLSSAKLFFHFSSYLVLPISLLDSTISYYHRSTHLSAICLSAPLNLNLEHAGVSGKMKNFIQRHQGKKKFSKRWPQTTNTGHIWSLLWTKHFLSKILSNTQWWVGGGWGPSSLRRSKGWFP